MAKRAMERVLTVVDAGPKGTVETVQTAHEIKGERTARRPRRLRLLLSRRVYTLAARRVRLKRIEDWLLEHWAQVSPSLLSLSLGGARRLALLSQGASVDALSFVTAS